MQTRVRKLLVGDIFNAQNTFYREQGLLARHVVMAVHFTKQGHFDPFFVPVDELVMCRKFFECSFLELDRFHGL